MTVSEITLSEQDVAKVRAKVVEWATANDPGATVREVEELTNIIVASTGVIAEVVTRRLRPALVALAPVVTAARTHADHDTALRDALAAYDEARKAAEDGGDG